MKARERSFKVFAVLVKSVGVIWVFGGFIFLRNGFVVLDSRWIYFLIGAVLLIGGVILIRVNPRRHTRYLETRSDD